MTTASGIVKATEQLYRSLFTAAAAGVVALVAWGVVITPFNSYKPQHLASVTIGVGLLVMAITAFWHRGPLYGLFRRQPLWLLVPTFAGVAALWLDGGWRSTYYLATYAAIAFAAVAASPRWAFICATITGIGYIGGLAVHGYTWSELQALKDADSVVANTGGYFLAAVFQAYPVRWLGGYVVRINQVVSGIPEPAPRKRLRTAYLSVREVEVVQLAAEGLSNDEIATRLVISPRTVQSHLSNAFGKTGAHTRTEVAVLAVREGLVPLDPDPATTSQDAAGSPANPHSGSKSA